MRDPRQQGEPAAAGGNDQGEPDQLEPLETIQDLEPTEDDADRIDGGATGFKLTAQSCLSASGH